MKRKALALILCLLSGPAFPADLFGEGEVQTMLLRLAPNTRLTRLPDGSAAYAWIRFIEPRTTCTTGHFFCTSYWRLCLVGKITGDATIATLMSTISTATDSINITDVVFPNGTWFKTNGVNLGPTDKDWCMG